MRWTELFTACLLVALLGTSGCTLGRGYLGSPLQADPQQSLVIGTTAKREVLAIFGPPDRIVRQRNGDVFVYQYAQRNLSELEITEPVFTRLTIFQWTKVQDKSDRLMVFFDPAGVVSAFGYRHGRSELDTL